MAIDHISPQQPHWDRNVNQVVDAINALLGEPEHLDNPVTAINGAKIYGKSDIYYWNVGDKKVVLLTVGGIDFGDPGSAKLVTPSGFTPSHWVTASVNQVSMVMYRAGVSNQWELFASTNNQVMGAGFSALYLADK